MQHPWHLVDLPRIFPRNVRAFPLQAPVNVVIRLASCGIGAVLLPHEVFDRQRIEAVFQQQLLNAWAHHKIHELLCSLERGLATC
jgi:hypothetical protein